MKSVVRVTVTRSSVSGGRLVGTVGGGAGLTATATGLELSEHAAIATIAATTMYRCFLLYTRHSVVSCGEDGRSEGPHAGTCAAATKHLPACLLLPGMPCFAFRPDRSCTRTALPRRTARKQWERSVTRVSPTDQQRRSPVRAGCRTGHERAIPLRSTMTDASDSGRS